MDTNCSEPCGGSFGGGDCWAALEAIPKKVTMDMIANAAIMRIKMVFTFTFIFYPFYSIL
jgi:hypothetical protein